MLKIKNLRWLIVGLLFVATALSFLDRQVLSISILKIQTDLNVSDVQYGWVNTGFLIAYALMFTLGGWLIDKFGTRVGLAVSVGLWSIIQCTAWGGSECLAPGYGPLLSWNW